MFEYVKLKNFKSFENLEFDLTDRNNNPKKLILIYGENGIGKSNLASAFFMLSETLYMQDILRKRRLWRLFPSERAYSARRCRRRQRSC